MSTETPLSDEELEQLSVGIEIGPWNKPGCRDMLARVRSLQAENARLRGVLDRAEYALGIAKYRLEGAMAYPGEPNSITASLAELRALLSVPVAPEEPK